MVRGTPPRLSQDPNEERMFTWRYLGSIHNRLIRVTTQLGVSLNRYVHKAILGRLEEDEKKLNDKRNE